MFERFTTDARQVVQVAQAEARSLNHGWVGTEHLLLGLLRQPTPAATALAAVGISHQAVMAQLEAMVASAGTSVGNDAELLNLLGIDLEEVRRRIDEAFGAGALDRVRTMPPRRRRRSPWSRRRRHPGCSATAPAGGPIPLAPRAKKVLELSLREALALRHHDIRPEHILLAILREGEGLAARILVTLGASIQQVRRVVLHDLAAS